MSANELPHLLGQIQGFTGTDRVPSPSHADVDPILGRRQVAMLLEDAADELRRIEVHLESDDAARLRKIAEQLDELAHERARPPWATVGL